MYAWRRPHDFNCNLCRDKESLMKLKGCKGKSQEDFIFPPLDQEYAGDRVIVTQCPVNFVGPDVITLFNAWSLADGRVSLSEQEELPPPYTDALSFISAQRSQIKVNSMKAVT